ncbi:hypothetical protein GCM10022251_79130 [Phytohabitans flavus]|uniref:FAD linked oxidase N-terminal domain-containing protein n=1 Tax=Phytohabitans flavus TaxID=1076124 RepID=A0A6F8XLU9_9ACTN|nr:hypothetical protein [Phytohabitans flavus]BCB74785.1 hypothetical protein Pflav_011950 [Phytohabitans flavus]
MVGHGGPDSDEQWLRLLAEAGPRGLIPRGGGCAYGDAAHNSGGHAWAYRPVRAMPLPRLSGRGLLASPAVAAANWLRLATARTGARPRLVPLAAALHPLE